MILPIILAIVFAVLVLGIVGWLVGTYNGFMVLRNAGIATLNQIRVALKKRLDLIGALAEAVKSYAVFEKDVLERVTRLRTSITTMSPEELVHAERETRSLLVRLLAIAESYPELRTVEAVKQLMQAARDVEDEIARHRYTYNNIIQQYNTMIDTIPSKFVARLVGLTKLPYLEVDSEELERRPSLEFYRGGEESEGRA